MSGRDPEAEALERAIAGALRSAIRDHGPITPEHIGSATKRVLGNLQNAGDVAGAAEILQRLYDSEINCRLSWVWQGGFEWELLDGDLNVKRWGTADTLEAAALAIAEAAARDFDGSAFMTWWMQR